MNEKDKSKLTAEIDRRMAILKEHEHDRIIQTGNQYEELNQALAKVIATPLMGELQSLRDYVENLSGLVFLQGSHRLHPFLQHRPDALG